MLLSGKYSFFENFKAEIQNMFEKKKEDNTIRRQAEHKTIKTFKGSGGYIYTKRMEEKNNKKKNTNSRNIQEEGNTYKRS